MAAEPAQDMHARDGAPALAGPEGEAPPSDAADGRSRLPIRPSAAERAARSVAAYFVDQDPAFWVALAPLLVLALLLFTRHPATNYIFDEQEALLANPYVNAVGGLPYLDAIYRDFWGLPHDRSIGSYRPVPNYVWRALWMLTKHPFFHHLSNVVLHAVNGALMVAIGFRVTRRRGLAWLSGAVFVACAVLTEAVSGIVGIADVLGGLGALLALCALGLPGWAMPIGVFAAMLLGLFSKESAVVCVPLVPFAALVAAPLTHPARPARVERALAAATACFLAFVLYVELRKRWFPAPLPADLSDPLPEGAPLSRRAMRAFLVWFHQPALPKDPLNNPLATAETPLRIAGALRVYWRGLTQVVFPKTLSGDYSFPQEPAPDQPVFAESVLGAAMLAFPPAIGIGLWIQAMVRERRDRARAIASDGCGRRGSVVLLVLGLSLLAAAAAAASADLAVARPAGRVIAWRGAPLWGIAAGAAAIGLGLFAEGRSRLPRPDMPGAAVPLSRAGLVLCSIGLVWLVVSYFPHSNIPVVLPTVRAERFWYFPVMGTSAVLAVLFYAGYLRARRAGRLARLAPVPFAIYVGFQGVQAYRHAMDYRDDLSFWHSTVKAVPKSAKAHLNYSVMLGARGNLETRLQESLVALELAPKWPMAHVYTGDTLCRMQRVDEAFPHYERGFEAGPNELSLIALALQCLWDNKQLKTHEDELRALAAAHPGSWLAYLAIDTLDNGEQNKGVDPKYRPRGYNEGPKDEK